MMRSRLLDALAALAFALVAIPAAAQTPPGSLDSLVVRLANMSAVTGLEDAMAESLLAALPGASLDRAGTVVVVRGSADPVRLALCPMDEIGYVVGSVTPEGYLTLRRVGATPMGPLYDQYLEGQRVTVFGRRGPLPGVVGIRSVHLTRGRTGAGDDPFNLDNAYVDIGATSEQQVRDLGVEMLAPVTREKRAQRYGADLVAAPNVAARAACAALAVAVQRSAGAPGRGTVVAAFTRRRHLRWDGASFVVIERARGADPSNLIVLGGAAAADSLGKGAAPEAPDSIPVARGSQAGTAWSLPTRYRGTPVETVSLKDVAALAVRLERFLEPR